MLSTRPTLRRIAVLAAMLSACAGVEVQSDYEPGIDFATYRTYAWLPQEPIPGFDGLLSQRIQSAVDDELGGKGLRLVAAPDAALRVTRHVSVDERLRVNDPYYAFNQFETYEQGTLVIDLVDADTRELVWRGSGEIRIEEYKTPEERTRRVREVVGAILDRYPPGP